MWKELNCKQAFTIHLVVERRGDEIGHNCSRSHCCHPLNSTRTVSEREKKECGMVGVGVGVGVDVEM
jgi:hypothetical protein